MPKGNKTGSSSEPESDQSESESSTSTTESDQLESEHLDNYLLNFDDSSDEEDYDKKVKDYTQERLKDSLQKFKQNTTKKEYSYYTLSFITHALGIKLLYSKAVQNKYYGSKENDYSKNRLLAYDEKVEKALPLNNNIKNWVTKCFNDVLYDLYFKLSENNTETSKLIWQGFKQKCGGEVQGIVENITLGYKEKRKFFKLLGKEEFKNILRTNTEKFVEMVRGYFNKIPENLFSKHKFAEVYDLNTKSITSVKKELVQEILNYINPENSYFSYIMKAIEDAAGLTSNGKLVAKKKEEVKKALDKLYKEWSVELEEEVLKEHELLRKKLEDRYNNLSRSNNLWENFYNKARNEILNFYLKQLTKPNKPSVYDEPDIQHLLIKEGFVKLTSANIKTYLIKNLKENNNSNTLSEKLVKELNTSYHEFLGTSMTPRKILDDHHYFDLTKIPTDDFFTEFLATLRLCNRSMKRMLKNRDDLEGKYKYFKEEGVSRGWLFPSSKNLVIDIHHLSTSDEPVRNDKTQSLGSYQFVYDIIKNIKTSINNELKEKNKKLKEKKLLVKDLDIAFWIELGIQGKLSKLEYFENQDKHIELSNLWIKENIFKDLTRIGYLMFGCEVVRNPAALIHNYMTLDLIKNNKITWGDAFVNDEGIMPMCMKGAVPNARKLHIEYSNYMPIPYVYDRYNSNDNSKKLKIREYKIVIEWLKMVSSKEEFEKCFKLEEDNEDNNYFLKEDDDNGFIRY